VSVFDPATTPRDVPALAKEVHATIGAGDAAHAGFVLGWLRTGNLRQAVYYSQAVAAAAVSQPQATSGLTPEGVRRFL
jgi:sugar/nucleoside kinase (ribokinase family)